MTTCEFAGTRLVSFAGLQIWREHRSRAQYRQRQGEMKKNPGARSQKPVEMRRSPLASSRRSVHARESRLRRLPSAFLLLASGFWILASPSLAFAAPTQEDIFKSISQN